MRGDLFLEEKTGDLVIYLVHTVGFFVRLLPLEDGVRYLIRTETVSEPKKITEASFYLHQRRVEVPDNIAHFAEKRALHIERLIGARFHPQQEALQDPGPAPEISEETEQEYAQTLRLIMTRREDLN